MASPPRLDTLGRGVSKLKFQESLVNSDFAPLFLCSQQAWTSAGKHGACSRQRSAHCFWFSPKLVVLSEASSSVSSAYSLLWTLQQARSKPEEENMQLFLNLLLKWWWKGFFPGAHHPRWYTSFSSELSTMKSDRETYTSKLLGWNEVKFGTVPYVSWRNPPLKDSPCRPCQIHVLPCLCKSTTESLFVHLGCDKDVQVCFCKKQYKYTLFLMYICNTVLHALSHLQHAAPGAPQWSSAIKQTSEPIFLIKKYFFKHMEIQAHKNC